MGTAIHTYLAKVFKQMHPDWIIPEVDWEPGRKITATFPSGVEVTGTPDQIDPDANAVVDVKTVNEFDWVKNEGTSQSNRYQRHTYALACIQNGLLDPTRTIYVGNLYVMRGGSDEVYLDMEEFDPTLTDEIDSWIEDVIYAMKTGEEASKDLPAPRCQMLCEFYGACRGGLPDSHDPMMITDEESKKALRMYVRGRDMEKEAKQLKAAASAHLVGVNGSDGEWQIRWTETAAVEVAGFVRKASTRIDVSPVKTS